MKTNISIPTSVFKATEKLAEKMSISLSDLFTIALASYVFRNDEEQLTEALNHVYAQEASLLEPEYFKVQVNALAAQRDNK